MNAPSSGTQTMLPLSKIIKGDNPRRYFDRRKHDELVVSIRQHGILQPILMRPKGDVFAIVAGERRYRAAMEAYGPEGEVPVTIREMTDQQALEAAIAENDDRDDPSETEQADAAVRHLAACHGDRAEAARRLGWSRSKLDRRLALAELSEHVKAALDERQIKVGHAELLAAVPADKQDKALETILGAGLDVAKTRELLARVTQDLSAAIFDKSECTACPFNSGLQRALFQTHVDAGHCTNPACYKLKTEAVEQARYEEEQRAAVDVEAPDSAVEHNDIDEARTDDGAMPAMRLHQKTSREPSSTTRSASNTTSPTKSTVTAKSLSSRTTDLREATWRTALARALASSAAYAQVTILVAAMTGTLSQIKADTLKGRAGLLVGADFPAQLYGGQIEAIRALPDPHASKALCAIAAAYAKDVLDFEHVADLARSFAVDIRAAWRVDQVFLERYTKDELRFIAQECGLIAHMGEKRFAKLLSSKKPELVAGMLNRPGFDWAGRLPSAMTLDQTYGAPPLAQAPVAHSALEDIDA